MRIALDCDETLLYTGKVLSDYYRATVDAHSNMPEEIWSSRWDIWGGDKVKWKKWFNGWIKSDWYTKMPAFDGAINAVKKLKEMGHELFVVSAGLSSETERRRKHLESIFGKIFNQVIVVNNSSEKNDVLKNFNIELFVDDDINNLANAAPIRGIAIKMPANEHQHDPIPQNVELADNWDNVLQLINKPI